MSSYDSFKKDWDKTKGEMEKLGAKKPAEVKTYGVLFLKIEKRVSSGIGAALKELDKAEPKDPKHPTAKEIDKFRGVIVDLKSAIKDEIGLIEAEVDKFRGEDGKVDKDAKTGLYRALKVFKAKLEHYEQDADLQLVTFEQTMDQEHDQGGKLVARFKLEVKERITKAALAVKQINTSPTAESYATGYPTVKSCIDINKSEAGKVSVWFENRYDTGDFQAGEFARIAGDLRGVAAPENRMTPDDVKAATGALGKLLKASIDALSRVTLPKDF